MRASSATARNRNTPLRRWSPVLPLSTALFATALCAAAPQVTITAQARGEIAPPQVPGTQDLQNGDFLILANDLAPWTGDGIDETTLWTFDFTSDPNYASFPAAGELTVALLTMTLTTPFDPGPPTDIVRPNGAFAPIAVPLFLNADTGDIEFDLLAFYPPCDLLAHLNSSAGAFPMAYADDAVVSFAELRLTSVQPDCIGDIDRDGDVDLSDLSILLSNFGLSGKCPDVGDLNGDAVVDLADLSLLLSRFGQSC